MKWRRRPPAIPPELVARIEESLAMVEQARATLDEVTGLGVPLHTRRTAHLQLRRAYDAADALLREATRIAKQHRYREWSQWRHLLSQLDTERQKHLLTEQDARGVLPICSVRAFDTGMSGPDIGDLLHGRAGMTGAPAVYGLDLEALLDPTALEVVPREQPGTTPAAELRHARARPVSSTQTSATHTPSIPTPEGAAPAAA